MHGKQYMRACVILMAGLYGMPYACAQGEEDALRLSWTLPGGTGRSAGMANAFGALGADPVAISINPAGFGLYRSSELSFTPGFEVNTARSTFYGTEDVGTRSRLFMNNMALVINNPNDKGGAWRSGTYGIAYDRHATHHMDLRSKGENVNSSIVERFVDEANGTPSDQLFSLFPWTSSLAWETYAIDPLDTLANTYQSAMPFASPMRHERSVESTGATNNTSFFYAGNYMDRLYIGASVGIVGSRFRRSTTHYETTLDEELEFRDVRFREDLNMSGSGIDIKLGMVGRLSDRLRLGAAYHSPRWMQMNDVFATDMRTSFRDGASYSASSPDGTFAYRVTTPWKAVISGAYIAGQNGTVSVDYEYMDARNMRLRPGSRLVSEYDFALENRTIASVFRTVHSVRIGTEWRYGPWYFRGGWGMMQDPWVDQNPRQGTSMKTYAAGLGYRRDHFAVDLALNYLQHVRNTFPYDPAFVQPIQESMGIFRSLLTISVKA